MTFIMGDGRAARNHCKLHQPVCGASVDLWTSETSYNTQVQKTEATLDILEGAAVALMLKAVVSLSPASGIKPLLGP